MNRTAIKDLIITSLDAEADVKETARILEEEGVSFNFRSGFTENIIEKISSPVLKITSELDFVKYLNLAFYRVALTGVAAIIILLISIFLMQGSITFDSFLGLSDSYDESIVFLLTGN